MKLKGKYSFDEFTHTHRIGNVIVPGITSVISPLCDYGGVPKHVLDAARNYGISGHKMIELYCNGDLDIDALDPALRHPLNEFIRFLAVEKIDRKDLICEIPMGDPLLQYGGIPDLILDGKRVIEIKFRHVNMLSDPMQVAAQEALWKKNGGTRCDHDRGVLELSPFEPYRYHPVNSRIAWSRFRHMLDYYHAGKLIQSWRAL